jgi:hypothetical protein
MNIDREVNMFDMSKPSPIYPCMFSSEQEQEIMRDKVYPVLLSLRHELGLFVWRVAPLAHNGKAFHLCDNHGFSQMIIDRDNGGLIKLHVNQESDVNLTNNVLETDNVRYALTRIRKMVKETSGDYALGQIKERVGDTILCSLNSLVSEWVNQSPSEARRRPAPHFTTATDRVLLGLYTGDVTLNTIPPAARDNLEKQVEELKQSLIARDALRNALEQSLTGKFLLFSYVRDANEATDTNIVMGGVRIGKVGEKFNNNYERYLANDAEVSLDVTHTYPFRVYRNFDELSERVRDYVMSRLTLNKMGRASSQPFVERKGLLPCLEYGRELAVFNDGLSMCWSRGHTGGHKMWFMIPDTRED